MEIILKAPVPVALLFYAAAAAAHEHHTDKIEEGKGTSNDPIVCRPERCAI
jgi:hypothetical protein